MKIHSTVKKMDMQWIYMALLACLCGCSSVVSTRPFGEAPLDLTTKADNWTGTWRTPAGPCAITVQDATNGLLAMTSTTPKGWWRWSNETQYVYLRTGGEWIYASIDCSEGTNACFMWGKVANDEGIILWWMPDPEKFKPLVESGELPGTIEKTSISKNQTAAQPIFPILGYTSSGEPIYETGVHGGPSEPFSWELEAQVPEMMPSTDDEEVDGEDPQMARVAQATREAAYSLLTGDEITLGDLKPEHYEMIASPTNGVLFAWECPVVLVKESARSDLGYLRAAVKRWRREQGK